MTSKGKPPGKKRGVPSGGIAQYPTQSNDRRQTVLHVVCEGHTERDYFQYLNRTHGERHGFILQLVPASQKENQGFKPKSASEAAARCQKTLQGDQSENVWAVFDRDEHTDIYAAFRLARETGLHIAFSSPSFDLCCGCTSPRVCRPN
jgi:hypothetical protein